MEERNYKVYIHTAPNGKVYIGITKRNPKDRWKRGRGYENNENFYKAILKYGWDNFTHDVLFEGLTEQEAEEKEIELIKEFKSNDRRYGYNIASGGLHCFHYSGCELPEYKEVIKSPKLMKLITNFIKMSEPQTVTETITNETYDSNGKLVSREVKETKRTTEPNMRALYSLLDRYEGVEELQSLIKALEQIRDKYDN